MQTVLFRFHDHYDICEQNLALLRRLNPQAEIHGLYGGRDEIAALPRSLKKRLTSIEQPFDDPFYCWKDSDLVVRKWYQLHGQALNFRHLYLVEWDLLFLAPLAQVFGQLQARANYTTIHATYRQARKKQWPWISGHYEGELAKLKQDIEAQAKPVTNDVSFGVMAARFSAAPFSTNMQRCGPPAMRMTKRGSAIGRRRSASRCLTTGFTRTRRISSAAAAS